MSPNRKQEISPADYAAQLAWRKAAAVARRRKSGLVLAADTVCEVGGQILNKPLDRADAERMIRLQEGHDTDVISGICLFRAESQEWVGAVEFSVVRFRRLSDQERKRYLDSNRWEGKSGAYGVQDRDPFVDVIEGSFSNVVGLPMERLAQLLRRLSGFAQVTPHGTTLSSQVARRQRDPQASPAGDQRGVARMERFRLRPSGTGRSWPLCCSCLWPSPSWQAQACSGPDFFGSSHVVEASAAMFDPPPQIDGKRAYDYLKKICEIGPRTAGPTQTPASARWSRLISPRWVLRSASSPSQAMHPRPASGSHSST